MAGKGPGRSGTVRIIGGRWRGRKLSFPALEGLRPTPDRVRETLFNWLTGQLPGARCLDLFAGSGALGLEALSRGAAHSLFIDADRRACTAIRDHLRQLDCESATVVQGETLAILAGGPGRAEPADIAFLDPPFGSQLLEPACQALDTPGWLSASARIYLETDRREPLPATPAGWERLREKTAGDVRYLLFVRNAGFD
jgi:16S rRNA (guanine966-N2)-methyltransferase